MVNRSLILIPWKIITLRIVRIGGKLLLVVGKIKGWTTLWKINKREWYIIFYFYNKFYFLCNIIYLMKGSINNKVQWSDPHSNFTKRKCITNIPAKIKTKSIGMLSLNCLSYNHLSVEACWIPTCHFKLKTFGDQNNNYIINDNVIAFFIPSVEKIFV